MQSRALRRARFALAVLAALAFSLPVEAFAKPRGCFTPAEQAAEWQVRHGLRLREGGIGCDGAPWYAGTKPLWESVDKQFGPQFKRETDIRAAAFQREFENDAEHKLSQWNARIVFYFRHYTLSPTYCGGIKTMLQDMLDKGWRLFTKQAYYARDEIRMTYEPCDK
jgi:hypothetical protein